MATRTGFRPRPLDTTRQLNIVRDIKELDDGEQKVSRDIVHSHEALDKDNEEARMVSSKQAKGGKEIPTPLVRAVPSYSIEYLPVHKEPRVYIRGKAGIGWQEDDEVDYDLAEEDRQWLDNFNQGQERLPFRRMELLLWRLDTANAEATDSAFFHAGATELERKSPAACATIDHMSREQAMEALTQVAAVRQSVKDAVYQYWLDKRKRLGKPLLRRLQPPTNPSDTNPHSCFRPREKINKPMLRNRRRGNDADSLLKLQTIRHNQLDAIKVVQFLIKRERKKRDITYAGVDLQQYQIKMRHEPVQMREAIEAEYAAAIKLTAKGGRRPVGFDAKSEKAQREAEGAAPDPVAAVVRKAKKRRRDTGRIHSIAALPPPPLPTEPEMLFANPVSLATITQQSRDSSAMPSLDFTTCCARVGRGGRLIMSRCQPFTYEPLDIQQPAEESQKMPFDLTAPYAAAAQAPQKPVSAAKQHSRGAGHSKQASPAAQASSRQQPQQQQQQPVSAGRVPASSSTQQAQQAQHAQQHQQAQPQAQPSAQGPGQNGHSPAAPAQPALQQTRQQQAQAQSQAQLIEMPIQPGASQTAPTPAKSKLASMKKGGTPAAAINGRMTPGSLKRGPGRPPKKQGSTLSNASSGTASKGATPMDLS